MVFDISMVYIKPILQNALEVDLHFKKTINWEIPLGSSQFT